MAAQRIPEEPRLKCKMDLENRLGLYKVLKQKNRNAYQMKKPVKARESREMPVK